MLQSSGCSLLLLSPPEQGAASPRLVGNLCTHLHSTRTSAGVFLSAAISPARRRSSVNSAALVTGSAGLALELAGAGTLSLPLPSQLPGMTCANGREKRKNAPRPNERK